MPDAEVKEEGWQLTGSVHAGPTMMQVGVDRIGHVTLSTTVSASGLGAAANARGALPPPRARQLRGLLAEALGEDVVDLEQALGPLGVLLEALRNKRPLCFNGDVLVAFVADVPDSDLWTAQAEMVLDAEDLAAIDRVITRSQSGD